MSALDLTLLEPTPPLDLDRLMLDPELREDAPQPILVGDRVRAAGDDLALGRSGTCLGLGVDPWDGAVTHDVAWDDGDVSSGVRGFDLRNVSLTEALEDDKHPRWPAGTPGGLGGKFKHGFGAEQFLKGPKTKIADLPVGEHFVGKKGTLYKLHQKSSKTTWAKAINLETGKPYPVQHHQEFAHVPHDAIEHPEHGDFAAENAPPKPEAPAAATPPTKDEIVAGLKQGEMWPARSGSGGLRNFGAMADGKLTKTAHDLVFERDHGGTHDPEAEAAVAAELQKRGLPAQPGLGDAPKSGTGKTPWPKKESKPDPAALAGQIEKSIADHEKARASGSPELPTAHDAGGHELKPGDHVTIVDNGDHGVVSAIHDDGLVVTDYEGTDWNLDGGEVKYSAEQTAMAKAPDAPAAKPDAAGAASTAEPKKAEPAAAVSAAKVAAVQSKLTPDKLKDIGPSGQPRNVGAMSDVKLVATVQHPDAEHMLKLRCTAELKDRGLDAKGQPIGAPAPAAEKSPDAPKTPAPEDKPPEGTAPTQGGDAVAEGGYQAYGSSAGPGGKYKHDRIGDMAKAELFVDKNGKAWMVVTPGAKPTITDGKTSYTVDGKLRGKKAEHSPLGVPAIQKLLDSQASGTAPAKPAAPPQPPPPPKPKANDVVAGKDKVAALPQGTSVVVKQVGADGYGDTIYTKTSTGWVIHDPGGQLHGKATTFGSIDEVKVVDAVGPAPKSAKAAKAKPIKGKQAAPAGASLKGMHVEAGDVVQVVKGGHNLTLVEPIGVHGGWKAQKPGGGTKVLYGHSGLYSVVKKDGSGLQTKDAAGTAPAGKVTPAFLEGQLAPHHGGEFKDLAEGTVFKTLDGKVAVLDPKTPAYSGYVTAWTAGGGKVEVPQGVKPTLASSKPIPGAVEALKGAAPGPAAAPTGKAAIKAAAQKATGSSKKLSVADTWTGITNGGAVKTKIAAWQKGTHAKLDQQQVAALEGYTDGSYSKINNSLRNEDVDEYSFAEVQKLDSVFDAIDGIPEDIITHRGTHEGALTGSIEPGKIIHDKGYMSTSPTKPWSKPVILHIRLKKGSKALWGPTTGGDVTAGEDEIILRRSTMMKVLQVESVGGTKHIYVEAYA